MLWHVKFWIFANSFLLSLYCVEVLCPTPGYPSIVWWVCFPWFRSVCAVGSAVPLHVNSVLTMICLLLNILRVQSHTDLQNPRDPQLKLLSVQSCSDLLYDITDTSVGNVIIPCDALSFIWTDMNFVFKHERQFHSSSLFQSNLTLYNCWLVSQQLVCCVTDWDFTLSCISTDVASKNESEIWECSYLSNLLLNNACLIQQSLVTTEPVPKL